MQLRLDPRDHWSWIDATGKDFGDLLHRIATADFRKITVGKQLPSFLLTASGKIQTQWTTLCTGAESWVLGFEEREGFQAKKRFLDTLEFYTFAEKYRMEPPSNEHQTLWTLGNVPSLDAPELIQMAGDSRFGEKWTIWRGPPTLLQSILGTFTETTWEYLEHLRIQSGYPALGKELTEDATPLDVGDLRGISISKGCYPGQEVIERTLAKGSPAKKLVQLQLSASTSESGSELFDENQERIGTITSVSTFSQPALALGFVKKTHAKIGAQVRLASGGTGQILSIRELPQSP